VVFLCGRRRAGTENIQYLSDCITPEKQSFSFAIPQTCETGSGFWLTVEGHGASESVGPFSIKPFFEDIKENEWYANYILKLWQEGIAEGHSGTNLFKPGENSTRAEFVKMAVVAFEKTQGGESTSDLENCSIPYEDWYGDVGPDDWYCKYVTAAYEKGWLTYDEDHPNFNPNELINRAEVAKLLVKARGEEHLTYFMTPSFANIFEDILEKTKDNEWFYGYAYLCKKLGIFDGYSSGEFCPHKPIVRAEVAKVICKAFFPNQCE